MKKFFIYTGVFFSLFYIIALYFTHSFNMEQFFNSDALYLPALYKDLVLSRGDFRSWYLTPAPYFFPDWILYFVSNYLFKNVYFAHAAFFCIQLIITFWLTKKIFSFCFAKNALLITALSFSVFLLVVAQQTPPVSFALSSAFHYGVFICFLLSIWLSLKLINDNKDQINKYPLFFVCLISLFATASDSLFLLQAALPIALAFSYLWLEGSLSTKRLLAFSGSIVLFAILGLLLNKVLMPNQSVFSIALSLDSVVKNINTLSSIFYTIYEKSPNLGAWTIIFYIILAIIIFFHFTLREVPDVEFNKFNIFLSVIFLASVFVTIFSQILISSISLTDRYQIPVYSAPILFFPLLINFISKKFLESKFFAYFGLLLFSAVLLTVLYRFPKSEWKDNFYPSEIACVDNFIENTGAKFGIAPYWQAKYMWMLSNKNIVIAQYKGDLSRDLWITNKAWYKNTYDFALTAIGLDSEELDFELLKQINGQPSNIARCGSLQVIQFNNGLNTRLFSGANKSYTWKACKLPGYVGVDNTDCNRIATESAHKSGHITFGPYIPLSYGQYKLEIKYRSSLATNSTAGHWDVVAALSKEAKQMLAGKLEGTNNAVKLITGEFWVPNEVAEEKFEFRTYYQGQGDLVIESMTLTKLQP